MFERYPETSVRALFAARSTAVLGGAPFIDVEHLVAGAIEAWSAAGSRRAEVLQKLGLTVLSIPPGAVHPDIEFSPAAKRVLHEAMSQADRLGHHRIRPEHLLLAALEDPSCLTATILRDVGLERDVLVQSAAQDANVDDSPLGYKAHLEARIIDP
ncbi:MAG: Clp protease N-terminal domain-containing protein [Vicinamibacterales bacterium]